MHGSIVLLVMGLAALAECNHRAKRVVGGDWVSAPPYDDPVTFVVKDGKEARVQGVRDPETGYYKFLGIRYAEPPVGNRRFQRSVPMYLEGELNATEWGSACLQPGANGAVIGSEDCLTLNVFTPALPDATDGHPVLIWIHGGNFRRGAATQYEMRNLVEKNTIVVSIQYRLGSLGFLSSTNKDLPGNNGLFDMILAVEWVRDYIEFFGGNPKKITAFGQGSGASSAYLLSLSKFGKSYFSGIIAMSGSILSNFAIDKEPMKNTENMATNLNCDVNDTVRMVYCLRKVDAIKIIEQDTEFETLTKVAKNFISDLSSLLNAGPVVEGLDDQRSLPNFVLDEPQNSLDLDDLPEIPLLTGVVKDETGGAVYGPFKDVIIQTLNAFPDFIIKELIPSLQKIVPLIDSITKRFVPEAFQKYASLPFGGGRRRRAATSGGAELDKVAQILNDAVFNVPAFLTVKNWSKKSKAFLYSFDHDSGLGYGNDFLGGLPLVGDTSITGKTSHGDDLGYIFEPNTMLGEPMAPKENMKEEDKQVKEVFTDIIANFARHGEVSVGAKKTKDGESSLFSLPSFTGSDDDGFLSITSKPQVNKQFRFCEMGLWTGIEERFKFSACELLNVDLKNQLTTIEKTIPIAANLPHYPKVGTVSEYLNVDELADPFDLPSIVPSIPPIPGVPSIPSIPPIPGVSSIPFIPNKLPPASGLPGIVGNPLSNQPQQQTKQQQQPSTSRPKIRPPGQFNAGNFFG